MCGICGTFGSDITKDLLTECTNRITHRGPDDIGVWMDDYCGLGHRRLSIFDLTPSGHQPMETADGRFHIIFNGEIYNFIEIRAELRKKNYTFVSESDTEVILYAYCEWGEECVNKFNGMWAFAIYDRTERTLFLSRDRFGVKPLYYAELNRGIGFASEMKAIMPMLHKVTVNERILTDKNMYMNYESGEECLIKEIKRLPAGHNMVISSDGIRKYRYWNTLDNIIDVPDSYEEQVENFRSIFIDACKIRMRSDVTLGTALSGGLDSSATICTMSYIAGNDSSERVNSDCQHAFVASMKGTGLDETSYAKEVTDYLGIELSEVNIDPVKALDRIQEYIYLFEDVYLTSPVPMMQTYEAMKKGGVTVTLDGHGADELFGGYTGDMLYALLDSKSDAEKRQILDTYFGCVAPNATVSDAEQLRRAGDFKLRHYAKKILGVPTWDRIIDEKNRNVLKKMDHYDRTLYNSTHMTILPTLLRNYDRYSMASAVEIRMPFLDYRLVSMAFSLTWRSKLRNGYSKNIIRDALRDIMPESIVNRRSKVGFSTPYAEWAQGPWKEWLMDEITSLEFKQCSYIDSNKVYVNTKSVIDGNVATGDGTEQIWMDLMPYLWEKYFLKAGFQK